ncbi:aromatic motif membrane protein [Mycoplasma sp. 332]|uniref:aromatic motif membrane protein n=1 Tax=Mycoplasma sp. 332 TaxID=3458236 RepID=UPI00403588C8
MKRKKIILSGLALATLFAPIAVISCQNTSQQNNKSKLSPIAVNDEKEKKWDVFLKYEYVNSLLDLAFKNNADKNAYIQKQKRINDNYLTEIKDYLLYANNVIAFFKSNDNFNSKNKVIALEKYRPELAKLFKDNWLWFLFNLDRFTFALYEAFNQFKGITDILSKELQKNSLDLGSFNRPKTNEMLQYVIEESSQNNKDSYDVYLLTKQGIILELSITKKSDGNSEVSIFTYSHIYPALFQNEAILKKFDLAKYVRALRLYKTSADKAYIKTLFDEEFGGEPLRFTIVYVDDSK